MVAPATAMPQMQQMAPQMMGMVGTTGMNQLGMMNSIQVQERANLIQEVTAMLGVEIDMANKYKVLDPAGVQYFYAVEKTDCCRRQMQNGCCHDCASWEVDVFYTPPQAAAQNFIKLKRDCQCTCCCINRPTANVFDVSSGVETKIGSFRDPCTCCGLRFEVRDEADRDVLKVDGGCCCCQPGMWCPLPCGPCSRVKFTVNDVNDGQEVATVEKKVPGCLSWLFAPDIDNYKVEFGGVQNANWKAILLAFTIFMDFRYFNTNRNEENAANEY